MRFCHGSAMYRAYSRYRAARAVVRHGLIGSEGGHRIAPWKLVLVRFLQGAGVRTGESG